MKTAQLPQQKRLGQFYGKNHTNSNLDSNMHRTILWQKNMAPKILFEKAPLKKGYTKFKHIICIF